MDSVGKRSRMSEDDEKPAWDPDGVLPDELHYFFERLIENAYGRPRTDFTIVAYTPILWTGWECDYAIVLLEIDGERKNIVLGGVFHPNDKGPAEMLRKRLEAYRDAIESTERFLAELE
jgi:hypothetical protein